MKYKAIIKFLGNEEGGRITPPMSGFRPQIKIGNETTSCIIQLLDDNSNESIMSLGIEHKVSIQLVFEKIYSEKLNCMLAEGNNAIELYEGSKLIGIGKIKV